ncbi:LOG family protein [Halomonas sp. LS-001]
MSRICVYLGSRAGSSPVFQEAATQLGNQLAERGHTLVYGGARIGLMGELANATLNAGGKAIGVMPDHLVEREQAHYGLTELIRVRDMHERKATMASQADGFIALPGGIGTLEELFEIWTWGYLGLHDKPIGLLNINDFYTPLLSFLDNTVDQGFLGTTTREMLLDAETPLTLLEAIEAQL